MFVQFNAKTFVTLTQQLQGKAVGATNIQHLSARFQNAEQGRCPSCSLFGVLSVFLVPDGGVGWGREILVRIQALYIFLKLFDDSVAAAGALQHVDAIGTLPERDEFASATDDTFGVITSHKVRTQRRLDLLTIPGALSTPVDELL